jgi:hypothetical protein
MNWPLHRRWPWIALAAIVVLAIGARIALPGWVTDYLNGKLDRMGDYHGNIESVDLHLWRGAYSINGLQITKRTAKVPAPLLDAPRTDLSVSWRALLDGGVVASVDFQRPEINFVDGDNEARQSGVGVNWRERLESLVPIRLDEVRVHDGTVRFRNFTSQPKVDLKATQIQARVLNLTNVRDAEDARAADLELTARMLGQAPLESGAKFDPFTPFEEFHFRVKLNKVDLRRLNEFLQAYAKLDVESGEGDFIMELEARDKQLNGYAKPLFYNVQIFSVEQDIENQGDNPLRALWEAVAGGIENLFKNQEKNQFATRVEIRGRTGDADTSAWQAIVAVVRNAFVKAFQPQFERLPSREAGENGDADGK